MIVNVPENNQQHPDHELLSTQRQCELMDLPRSSYYRKSFLRREADKNLALIRLIDKEYTKHPFYGTRKMRDYLRRQYAGRSILGMQQLAKSSIERQ